MIPNPGEPKKLLDMPGIIFFLSHSIFFCILLVFYLKIQSLHSLKIMKKSPTIEYSDLSVLDA